MHAGRGLGALLRGFGFFVTAILTVHHRTSVSTAPFKSHREVQRPTLVGDPGVNHIIVMIRIPRNRMGIPLGRLTCPTL